MDQIEQSKIDLALDLARLYGPIEGSHHRIWVIDQMVRALTGNAYDQWIEENTYEWETGIAP